ncbi:hypothetical protein [Bradyrhizobium japonicum]|uniref:hypothetical protein n=1 Tax=Bradyrhizobium japonicum TaxID=375 RepID=UPI00200E8770|nr:hypothetical protein [Bradyrhizobium japonicum]UQE03400.1 hypothetical protein JEY30_48870 [Bradyrhizobium japonicum]
MKRGRGAGNSDNTDKAGHFPLLRASVGFDGELAQFVVQPVEFQGGNALSFTARCLDRLFPGEEAFVGAIIGNCSSVDGERFAEKERALHIGLRAEFDLERFRLKRRAGFVGFKPS